MRLRRWILWVVLALPFGLPGVGTAQVDDAPSLAGVIDIHAHAAPETSMLNFKRAFDAIEAAQIARIYGMRGIVLKEHTYGDRLVGLSGVSDRPGHRGLRRHRPEQGGGRHQSGGGGGHGVVARRPGSCGVHADGRRGGPRSALAQRGRGLAQRTIAAGSAGSAQGHREV